MIKRSFVFAVLLYVIVLSQTLSFAQSPPIFGPNKYERTTGAPNTYSNSFQACNTGATYKLTVENGEGGKNRISSASITLNDNEIVKENEFNQKVDKIEKTISLQQENTLNIKLASGPGGFIKVSVSCVANCLEVKITTPAAGSTINKSKTIINGSLYNVFGEMGIVLKSLGANGEVSVLAQTQAVNFAGIIPLQTGANTIIATATDACGYKAEDTITVNTESMEEPVRLTATPNSGILSTAGTLDVTLEAETSIENPVSKYSWDLNGDGRIDQEGSELTKATANYQNTGLYFPSVTVTDTQGNTYTEITIVNVLSREEMDNLLKGKWDGMKGKLASGIIETAVSYFEEGSQSTYKDQFIALQSVLNNIANEMGQINLVKVEDDRAEYEIITTRNGTTYSFHLLFVRDANGLWKIKVF